MGGIGCRGTCSGAFATAAACIDAAMMSSDRFFQPYTGVIETLPVESNQRLG